MFGALMDKADGIDANHGTFFVASTEMSLVEASRFNGHCVAL
jgi:hypothetical protein